MGLSVLMSVYAKERPEYLAEALRSLALQTRKADEVILVEDGPISPELESVIEASRTELPIVSLKLPKNVGLARALNEGLNACANELVARMDTDDVSLPERFARQVQFMNENPHIAVCSSHIEERNESMSKTLGVRLLPEHHDDIVRFAKNRNPISHPAVIYRREAIVSVGGYPDIYPEDYPMWCLMMVKGYRFANIPVVTVLMRTGEGFIARRGFRFFRGIVKALWFQKKIGFIGWPTFFKKLLYRAAVHLAPAGLRRTLYKHAREK